MKTTHKLFLINTVVAASFFASVAGVSANASCSTGIGVMTTCSGSTPYCAYPDTGMWREGTGRCQATQPVYTNRSSTPTGTITPGNPGTTGAPMTAAACTLQGGTWENGACTLCGTPFVPPMTSPTTPPTPSIPTPMCPPAGQPGKIYIKNGACVNYCEFLGGTQGNTIVNGQNTPVCNNLPGAPTPTNVPDTCIMYGCHWSNGMCLNANNQMCTYTPANPGGASVLQTLWNFLTHRR